MEYVGILRNAEQYFVGGGKSVIRGAIFDDKRGRWPDGEPITTSSLTAIYHVGGQLFVGTRNSVYLLEDFEGELL